MKQPSLAETGFLPKAGKQTRKAVFLAEMEQVVPWSRLEARIDPHYPNKGNDRPPMPLGTMLRIHFLQQGFGYSDPAREEAWSVHTDFVLDALEQAPHARPSDRNTLVHHSDQGARYVSIRDSERLGEAGIAPSVGSKGDSYDNALAETINGLHKAEIIHRRGPWKTLEAVELATLEWVSCFNHHRLLESIGYIPRG